MDKDKFIQDLLNLIQAPIRPGETAPILSQEQIEALYSAPDTTTAAQYAITLGLGDYVNLVGQQIPSQYFEEPIPIVGIFKFLVIFFDVL